MTVFSVLVTVLAVLASIVLVWANHTTGDNFNNWHIAIWAVVALFWIARAVG